jgi:hypothetical protein
MTVRPSSQPVREFTRAFAAFALSGYAASSNAGAGPTCDEFLHLDDQAMQAAIVEWARDNDARVDPENPNAGLSGFALFQDRASLITYRQASEHRGEHLGDLSIAPGG